jgi:signal peptidase I
VYLLLISSRGLITSSLILPVKIAWSAMSPTLNNWEYYASVRTYTSIKRWDIVSYKIEWITLMPRVGRIVWLPDETIGFSEGNVYLVSSTGSKIFLNESYLSNWTKTFISLTTWVKEFKIPPDSYFIIWDNRANSSDSRYCFYKRCDEIHKNRYLNQYSIVGKIY